VDGDAAKREGRALVPNSSASVAIIAGGRTLVVANKGWEADPLVTVLTSARSRPAGVTYAPVAGTPGLRGTATGPRGPVEIWCLQELMDPHVSSSNSAEKARVLQPLLAAPGVALVVAFGTAATPGPDSLNGCVVVGTRAFVHDAAPPGSPSTWKPPAADRLQTSPQSEARFSALAAGDFRPQVESRLLAPPLRPAHPSVVLAAANYTALSTVNVVKYDDFAWADPETLSAFQAANTRGPIGSLETTHGIIRTYTITAAAFLFVSGIANRIGRYNAEVQPRDYAQNFVAAHNAAVALAFLIPALPP
jgi:hypothetical protein